MNLELKEAPVQSRQMECWYAVPTDRLIERLLATHRRWVFEELPWIDHLLDGVETGRSPEPAVKGLRRIFNRLRREMIEHLLNEENVLFPAILELERSVLAGSAPQWRPFGSVNNPVKMMEQEHGLAVRLWEEVRKLTRDYTPAEDAVRSMSSLYQELQALDDEVCQHSCLEDQILFPRARRLEQTARRATKSLV
jgi:regulator of cell morphogenesis and NO signaling